MALERIGDMPLAGLYLAPLPPVMCEECGSWELDGPACLACGHVQGRFQT